MKHALKKTFAWGFCNTLAPVISAMNQYDACDVRLWVGNTPDATYNIRRFFFGNFPRVEYRGCSTELYQQVYAGIFQFIDMINRHNKYNDRTFHDYVNLFNRLVDIFYQLLSDHQIELILFSSLPHEGPDWILYLLGQAMGCQTVVFYQSLFPQRYFFAFHHQDFGWFKQIPNINAPEPFSIPRQHEKDIFYMKNQKPYRYRLREVLFKDFRKKRFNALWVHRNVRRYQRQLQVTIDPGLDFSQPYVYFPLHLQPEMTTATLGDEYNDQLLAIERLSKAIPSHWHIYVKENPIQTEVMRGDWFFDRLKSLPCVKIVPTQTNTHQLIQHSQFVATITGTAGWEAITGGKNVLVFGRPWYLTLPGVFRYQDGVSRDTLVNQPIDHAKLEEAVSQLLTKTGVGIMDEDYIKICPNFDAQENGRLIADFIKTLLSSREAVPPIGSLL